ncbi:MAG: DUF362 domain-containing protein [Candidatus Methylomirabilia bacterium]
MSSRIALVQTADRAAGVRAAVALLGGSPARGVQVLLKPNFNTADPYPGSTHNDTLESLVTVLQSQGAAGVTVADRCGPAQMAQVLAAKGVPELCRRLGAEILDFEALPPEGWVRQNPKGSAWLNGFFVARPVLESPCVVSTCCLKTHGFGGVFTMSLKNSIGMVHRRNMRELHASLLSMRRMIAEVNTVYRPALVVLDGIEAFVDGGPMTGTRKPAGVVLAGTDRVAVDAVGLAVLKEIGANRAVMEKPIFAQGQIARAVELGLGAAGPEQIELVTGDAESAARAAGLRAILDRG